MDSLIVSYISWMFYGLLISLGLYGLMVYVIPPKQRDAGGGWALISRPVDAVGVSIFIYFAAFFLSQLLAGVGAGVYAAFQQGSAENILNSLEDSIVLQTVFAGVFYGLIGLLVYGFLQTRRLTLRSIGWLRPRWRDLGYAVIAIICYLAIATVVAALVSKFVPGINLEQKQEIGFENANTILQLTLVFVSLVILPPIIEELLTRGLLYTGLRTKLRVRASIFITSLVFAVAHLQLGTGNPPLWTAAIDTFILSIFLCYLREKTGSLWPSIFMHAIKNGMAFVALFILHIDKL
jgi:uncharacterized protein